MVTALIRRSARPALAAWALCAVTMAGGGCYHHPKLEEPIVRQAYDREPIAEPEEETEGQWALWDGTDKMVFYRVGQLFNLGRSLSGQSAHGWAWRTTWKPRTSMGWTKFLTPPGSPIGTISHATPRMNWLEAPQRIAVPPIPKACGLRSAGKRVWGRRRGL